MTHNYRGNFCSKPVELGEEYDHEFVDDIPPKYTCSICIKVLKKPRLVGCCGQHYCESCLQHWVRECSQRMCPHCRAVGFQSMLNKEKMREIQELRIHCTNHVSGCTWVGELGTLKDHLQSDRGCGYVKVKCSNEAYVDYRLYGQSCITQKKRERGATHLQQEQRVTDWQREQRVLLRQQDQRVMHWPQDQRLTQWPQEQRVMPKQREQRVSQRQWKRVICEVEVERKYLDQHKQECKYRQYTCEYCGYVDTYDAIAGTGKAKKRNSKVKASGNHYEMCDEYPLDCINGCGKKGIKRKNMQSHKNVCPLEKLKCPFSIQCRNDILRKDMDSHKQQCDFRPQTCEFCGQVAPYNRMSSKESNTLSMRGHYDACQHYPLQCVNQCGAKDIKRKDMSDHCDVCPLQPLTCPFGTHKRKILRKDMEKHKNEECELRPFTCQYCNQRGTYKSITGKGESLHKGKCHYEVCDNYPLECPNSCGEKNIKRKDMSGHCDVCPLQLLSCPFGTHKRNILRKDMEKHKKECELRPYTCQYCNQRGTYKSITGKGEYLHKGKYHYEVCDHYPLQCPNSCGEKNIKRKDMSAHQNTCPLQLLECPFKYANCKQPILRKDMKSHCDSYIHEHLLMMAKSHQILAQKCEELTRKCEKLTRKNEELTSQVEELTWRKHYSSSYTAGYDYDD